MSEVQFDLEADPVQLRPKACVEPGAMSNVLRRAWALSILAGCSTSGLDVEAGRETGACIEGSCFDGLECLSDLCVGPEGETEGPGPMSGGSASTSGMDPSSPSGPQPSTTASDDSTSGGSAEESGEPEPPIECDAPAHSPCDGQAGNAFRAMGVNCEGEPQLDVTTTGSAAAVGVRTGFGNTETWAATEGSRFAVIGTGFTTDLDSETPDGDSNLSPTHCSDDLGVEYDVGTLPTPLDQTAESIAANWSTNGAFDYTELRIAGESPGGATSVAFDFAFFSAEYPGYVDGNFNDMFVAWLESESWTGNLAFDDAGEAITQSSELVTVRDDMAMLPELAGTCMRGHAASEWLRTTAPLPQGEAMTLAFAIFDMSDSVVDSFAFIDNITFGCETVETPTTTALE